MNETEVLNDNLTITDDVQQSLQLPSAQPSMAMMSIMERASLAADIPRENLQQIYDMQMALLKRDEEKLYYRSLAACQMEIEPIIKNKRNAHTKSSYADLEAIITAIKPIYAKHGFSVSVTEDRERSTSTHTALVATRGHSCGHKELFYYDSPNDGKGIEGKVNKTDPHAKGSAVGYGRRYLHAMMWDLATADDDGNRAGSIVIQRVTPEQVTKIKDLISQAEIAGNPVDVSAMLAACKAESIEDIKSADLAFIMPKLESKVKP